MNAHKSIAGPTMRATRMELGERIRTLREEERLARRREDLGYAEEYREAANALEDALAEVEAYLSEK